MDKKRLLFIGIGCVIFVFFVLLAFPIKVTCKVPGYTCTSAPDENGRISRSYDIEPILAFLIESITRKDCILKYKEGLFMKNSSS